MKINVLQQKKVLMATVAVVLFSFFGATKVCAQQYFYATCESGQNLYYKITDATNHYVILTHPNNNPGNPWGYVTKPSGNMILPETVTYNNVTYTVKGIDQYTFSNCTGLTGSLVIPNNITTIGMSAFSYCTGFSGTLTISNSITSIEVSSFEDCRGFTGPLIIPNSVTKIGANAFFNCSGFTETLTLPANLVSIGSNAFEGCHFTGTLTLPSTVTAIGYYAFKGCNFTGDLIIPRSLDKVRQGVFQNCTGINTVVIPSTVIRFYENAFNGCSNLQAIYVAAESAPVIDEDALSGINRNIPVYVPYCAVDTYTSTSGWSSFSHFYGRSFYIADGNWTNSNNWTCETVPSEDMGVVVIANCDLNASETVTSLTLFGTYVLSVLPDKVLNVSNTIQNRGTAANLVIKDGGQLLHNQNGVLATVEKSITGYDANNNGWHLISSPIANTTDINAVQNLLNNEYDLYYYDEPTVYWINQKNATNNFTELSNGMGYLYANSQNVSLDFAGALQNGSSIVNVPLSYTEEANLKGFNLVGNPYAHNVTSYGTTNVAEQGCFRMNENATNVMVSEISETNPLKPGEGFFVLATAEGASVTFNAATRSENIEKTGSINLEIVENGKISDRLIVKRFDGMELNKISIRENCTKLFALKDKNELAIVVSNGDEQPINFNAGKNGVYTINVTIDDVETDYLHLIDNLKGIDIDLLKNDSYTFEANTNDYASRFRLVFQPSEDALIENFAYTSNGNLIIANEDMATLQIIDMSGRVINSETFYGDYNKSVNLSKGVYVLRLIKGDDVKTQKIVID